MSAARPSSVYLILQALGLGLITLANLPSCLEAQTRFEAQIRLMKLPELSPQKAHVDTEVCEDFSPARLLPSVEGGGLPQVALWLEALPAPESPARADETHKLQFQSCEPDRPIVFMKPGDTLEIFSSDAFTYDLLIEGEKSGRRRRLLPSNIQSVPLRMTQSEVVRIQCELHPSARMLAIVTESMWRTVADSQGLAMMENIPQGQYRLRLWHPVLGGRVHPEILNLENKNQKIEILWPEAKD